MQEVFEKILKEVKDIKAAPKVESTYNNGWIAACEAVGAEIEQTAAEYNNGWIPCSERLPNRDECLKDGRKFIVTDGNRRYQSSFNIYSRTFKTMQEVAPVGWFSLKNDNCVIAWQPLPEPYQPKGDKMTKQTQTQADRIRSMSDEELADFLDLIVSMDYVQMKFTETIYWLRSEVEE